jgi:hypothetical protein
VGGSGLPHPRRHPDGHSFGTPEPAPSPLDPARWRECAEYLHGIDLFNRGFYWEAHEAWEAVWVGAGRKGPVAELARGLIKLAAAGVKVRQGRPGGVRVHAAAAARHLRRAAAGLGSPAAGLDLAAVIGFAERVGERAERWPRREGDRVAVVFDRALEPE